MGNNREEKHADLRDRLIKAAEDHLPSTLSLG